MMETKIIEQICHEKKCTEKIKVRETFKNSYFHTVGYCDFHTKVFLKKHDLFKKMNLDQNQTYKNDRKEYNRISKIAKKMVESEIQ